MGAKTMECCQKGTFLGCPGRVPWEGQRGPWDRPRALVCERVFCVFGAAIQKINKKIDGSKTMHIAAKIDVFQGCAFGVRPERCETDALLRSSRGPVAILKPQKARVKVKFSPFRASVNAFFCVVGCHGGCET